MSFTERCGPFTVSVIPSIILLKTEDLEEVFRLVNNYLDPGGIFVFDFNTEYKYREVIGQQYDRGEPWNECSFIWEN